MLFPSGQINLPNGIASSRKRKRDSHLSGGTPSQSWAEKKLSKNPSWMCSVISFMAAVGWIPRGPRMSKEIAIGLSCVVASTPFPPDARLPSDHTSQVDFKSLPLSRGTVSGTTDPRTTTTLILFEEFVPLEYRQQLTESGSGRRRRLPSLFSSSKKTWKPATTLNGRPYVVGHVPRSPSYREVEFEGLLSTNGSVTKIISLKPPERRPSTIAPSPISSFAPTPIVTKPPHPFPFLTSPQADTSSIKRASSRQSNAESPTVSIPSPPATSPVKKSSRFRLPVSPSGPRPRTTGLPPAEYDTVDFEARLATSFDEDDFDDATPSKHSRRESMDDAWVDILVASSSRRMTGQDADPKNGQGLKGGRSDPELASQEVSQVLASVTHVQSEDEDDDMEPVNRLDAEVLHRDDSTAGYSMIGLESIESTPAPSIQVEGEDEEPIVATPPSKRLGYFDLHPERRTPKLGVEEQVHLEIPAPSPATQSAFDDSRSQSERNSLSDDPRSVFERPSLDSQASQGDSSYEGTYDISPSPPLPPKDISVSSHQQDTSVAHNQSSPYLNEHRNKAARNTPSPPIPAVDVPQGKDLDQSPEPPSAKPIQSKTASLIEMYREREKGTNAVPFPPSRLPVRTGASLTPPAQVERPVSPVPSVSPAPSSPASNADLPLSVSAQGVAILQPYVHGAPLHNVLEEEEEEEE